MTSTAAVIVTYNSEHHIGACLRALLPRCEMVLVVDNASEDATCRIVAGECGVRLIANRANLGFAAAVNQAVAMLECRNVLLLNPDAELLTGLEEMERACDDSSVAAAGGKLVGEDGSPQAGFNVRCFPTPTALAFEVLGLNRLIPGNPVNRRYRCRDLDLDQPATVEQPAGAFLMVKRAVWEELGGFDERFYPLWFDEVDFLRRAYVNGYTIRYVPAAVARHAGGHSLRRLSRQHRELYWYGNLMSYADKHFGSVGRVSVCAAVLLGSMMRMAGIITRRNRNPVAVYSKVIQLGFQCLIGGRTRRTTCP